jgi:peptidoglycan/LPS O-acetylase OafA/YrhL
MTTSYRSAPGTLTLDPPLETSAAAEPQTAPSPRIADIEMLRGAAVLFVVLQHAPIFLIPWPSRTLTFIFDYFGFSGGVDLFFAISGFVIGRSLLPVLERCADDAAYLRAVLAFWIRRAWRLLPSAWLWLALALTASVAFNRSGAFKPFEANIATTVAALANVEDFHGAQVWPFGATGTNFVYWSLSLEEQFYLLLPVAAFLCRRRLPWLLAGLAAVQFVVPRSVLLNFTRTDAILLGVLVAIWSRDPTFRLFEPTGLRSSRAAGPALLIIALFGMAAITAIHHDIVSCRSAMVTLISTALVLVASYDRDYLWPPGLAKRLLIWVGSRSYGLYLIHVPTYFLTREIWYRLLPEGEELGPAYTLRFAVTALVLLFTLAEANYRLVESPLRRHGAEIAARFAARTVTEFA